MLFILSELAPMLKPVASVPDYALFLTDMNFHGRSAVVLVLLGFQSLTLLAAQPGPPPSAEKKPVYNEYQGVKVEDDYQWLEEDNNPAVKAWSDAENKRTHAYLDSLPGR